ncbi:MAG: N-acetyltransferase [Hyphomicrobiales bacterium]|jgi:predicted N-acetyltransferase YhbS|nr:N-acetyltransferase [Hyphomicrobiales bacterium]
MNRLAFALRPESPLDDDAIERLHERAFGPGRYARTAFRLREGRGAATPQFCFSALVGSLLVGSVRQSPVLAGGVPALILGPLTVDPSFEGVGIGSALMRTGMSSAAAAGETLILLVGDEPYYRRFGFVVVPAGQLVLPGPVNPARFLAAELAPGALAAAKGAVRPRPATLRP